MRSLQYFQPMVHSPMIKLDDVYRLTKPAKNYLVYKKPIGIDVYIVNGKIFDFNNKEIVNNSLKFELEKVLNTSVSTQSLVTGVLTLVGSPSDIFRYSPILYSNTANCPSSIKLIVHDIIFPYFSINNSFTLRTDIVKKVFGSLPNCVYMDLTNMDTFLDFKKLIKEDFNLSKYKSLLIFDKDGDYVPGNKQLGFYAHEKVSFELSPNQKYRGHIKKIHPINVATEDGKIVKIAYEIETRFKNKKLNIPINTNNFILKKSLWEERKTLKRIPFLFEGIYFEEEGNFEILGLHYSKLIL